MKQLFLHLFFFLLTTIAYSQEQNCTVYLKNGTTLRGELIENVPNKHLVIRLEDGTNRTINHEEVERFVRENRTVPSAQTSVNDTLKKIAAPENYKTNGRVFMMEVSAGTGLKKTVNGDRFFGLHIINGYRFNRYLTLAAGVGIERFTAVGMVPVFLDVRVTPREKKLRTSPSFNAAIGYAFTINNMKFTNEGGVCINPSIGIRRFTSKNAAFHAALGIRLQQGNVYTYSFYGVVPQKYSFVFMTLNLGMSF